MGVIDSRVVNVDDVALERFEQGGRFASDGARLGPLVGAKDLGCSYDVVPPGKCACPFHSHRGETRKIRTGDVICCPTGGPETAHQIVNDSDAPLAYLSISTRMPAEVCEYPDSGKVGAFGPGLRHMTRAGDAVDYWTDEA